MNITRKRLSNSELFPEAWKVFVDCVRKWKDNDINPTWLYANSPPCIVVVYKISGTLHIFLLLVVCTHSLLHHISG